MSTVTRFALSFFSAIFFIAGPVVGQHAPFTPATVDQPMLNKLVAQFEQQHKTALTITALPSKYRKDYEEVYNSRWEHIKGVFDRKEVYTAEPARKYMADLVDIIVKGNPSLKAYPLHCYFSRTSEPNASYIGQGIILFNMGLFEKLENESQAAFVLCHEIAHYVLQHSDNSISEYISTINSASYQQELRKVKHTEFRKRELLEKLTKKVAFNHRRHSRDHESQADSMALALLKNTSFDLSGAVTALKLLDEIDKDTIDIAACFKRELNPATFPFWDKWIAKSSSILGAGASVKAKGDMDDSLKTHPDCQTRIRLLEPAIAQNGSAKGQLYLTGKERFSTLQNTFKYEIIEYAYQAEKYSNSFYHTLILLQQYPKDPYLVTQIGRIMNSSYTARKAHTLGRMVDLPAPEFTPGYNLVLQFFQNLYLEEYAEVGYHYLQQYSGELSSYPAFKEQLNKSSLFIKQ